LDFGIEDFNGTLQRQARRDSKLLWTFAPASVIIPVKKWAVCNDKTMKKGVLEACGWEAAAAGRKMSLETRKKYVVNRVDKMRLEA